MNKTETVNVLMVDDRPDKLMALESILEPLQQNLITAQSGKDALRLVLHHDFAVILLDINMPDMDGFETASLIRERERTRDIPIIFISALEPSDDRVKRAYSLRAVDYVPAPAAAEVLLAKVSVFCDLHRNAKRLQEMSHELQVRNQQLQTFCYAMAHDLRAPLRALRNFSGILFEDYAPKLDEQGKELLQRVHRSAARMDNLIVDLLKFIRLENIEVPVEAIDLHEILTETLRYLDEEIRTTGTNVTIKKSPLKLCGHKEILMHVLVNLLCNAIKFVAEGKKPEIQITWEPHGEMVRVSIHDNGVGIEPRHQDKVFALFEQLQPAEQKEGSGLGLSIVKTSIERMNGTVGLQSDPDKGSIFWFELPRARSLHLSDRGSAA